MLSAHDLVTIALVYLAIGSAGWSMLFASGAIHDSYQKTPSIVGLTIASIGAIIGWPIFVLVFVLGVVHGWRRGSRKRNPPGGHPPAGQGPGREFLAPAPGPKRRAF